jgi:hypothetical protein
MLLNVLVGNAHPTSIKIIFQKCEILAIFGHSIFDNLFVVGKSPKNG